MPLTTNDLQEGDLLFSMSGTFAAHVQIFSGKNHFEVTTLHAVNDEKKGLQKVMATSFSASETIRVLRCKKKGLASRAVNNAKQWARYETPYALDRIHIKSAYQTTLDLKEVGEDAKHQLMLQHFKSFGKYRAIKYATRRNGIVCYPGEDNVHGGPGLTCCMFAILCYQVAGIANLVFTAEPPLHVSDKKMDRKDLEKLMNVMCADKTRKNVGDDFNDYCKYARSLHEPNPYGIDWDAIGKTPMPGRPVKAPKPLVDAKDAKGADDKSAGAKVPAHENKGKRRPGVTYVPSILFWNSSSPLCTFDFGSVMTPGLQLDAKIATPANLLYSLCKDKTNWDDLGHMTNEVKAEPSAEAKARYKQVLADLEKGAVALRAPFTKL